jgi:hypothetical protein
MPSDSISARFPKMTVNTTMAITGWTMAQPIPRTDWAYLPLMSRHTRKKKSSLYSRSSPSPKPGTFPSGSMTTVETDCLMERPACIAWVRFWGRRRNMCSSCSHR